jgi:DNA invertase Pin-like site-specific DNA recombinase
MSALPRLIIYARTSTDDQQSPEDSLAWQVSLAKALIAGRAEVIDIVHETDTSRSIPWTRRHRAAELLAELYSPDRRWDGIVVGEPQRAFGSAMQVQLILPQLADAGASLWCPEVGGPVDPNSEAHDIVLNLFGGLSKAERRRLQTRVKAAKEQQASTGRFQGGRPPYGYRLVSTGIPHPNPKKAHWGAELQRLEPDPETAPWVQRIFAWRIAGDGYGTIASRLDELGVLCPSAHDRQRNPHRSGRAWGLTTVAAIVQNPRYRGDDAYGRYRKVERLYDRRDPSAGFVTKLVPADEATWVMVEGSVPALVTTEEWAAAQPDRSPAPKGGRRPDQPSRYALRGLVVCHQCGHVMQGNTVGRSSGRSMVHYRCVYRTNYPGDEGHPRSLAVAERRILPVMDAWLARLFDPDHIEETVDTLLRADRPADNDPPPLIEARRLATDAETRLARHVAAIDAGVDPSILVAQTREAQADLARANAIIAAHTARATLTALTPSAIRAVLLRHEGFPGLLRDVATPDERRKLYAGLGIRLSYERRNTGGQTRELIRPSLSPLESHTTPWSNSPCRRGDLNSHQAHYSQLSRVSKMGSHQRPYRRELRPRYLWSTLVIRRL